MDIQKHDLGGWLLDYGTTEIAFEKYNWTTTRRPDIKSALYVDISLCRRPITTLNI